MTPSTPPPTPNVPVPSQDPPKPSTIFGLEPVVGLLFLGMIVFTAVLITCEKFFPDDGQLFQVMAGLVTGFSGAFFMRVKPNDQKGEKGQTGQPGTPGPQGGPSGPVIVQQNIEGGGGGNG